MENRALIGFMVAKKKQRKAKKFTVPKVKVEKRAFDRIIGKLIQAKPEARK